MHSIPLRCADPRAQADLLRGSAQHRPPDASPAAARRRRQSRSWPLPCSCLFPEAICYVMVIELREGNFRQTSFSAEGIEQRNYYNNLIQSFI